MWLCQVTGLICIKRAVIGCASTRVTTLLRSVFALKTWQMKDMKDKELKLRCKKLCTFNLLTEWFHVTAIDIALSLNRLEAYVVLSIFLVRFKNRRHLTILTVHNLVCLYPLVIILPPLGCNLCNFYILKKINLKSLIDVISLWRPGTSFAPSRDKVESCIFWAVVLVLLWGRCHLLI